MNKGSPTKKFKKKSSIARFEFAKKDIPLPLIANNKPHQAWRPQGWVSHG